MSNFDDKVTKIEYNVLNKISAIVEPSGAKTVIEYDKMWNVSKVIFANEASQEYHYNILNQLESFTNELGGKIYYKYDSNGNVVEIRDDKKSKITKTYDALNRELEIFENNRLVTSYEYDSVGNVIKAVDGANNYQRFEYDLNNNLVGSIDQEGHKTSYTYTSLNEIETITNPYGGQIRYEYYSGRLLKKVIDADNNYEFYEYDVLQNVKKITYSNKSYLDVEYDVLGNIIKETNDFGLSKHYKYDVSNNVIEIKDESNNVTLYEYDINNNLVKVVDCLNGVMEYDYDIMNNLRTVSQINESNSQRLYEYQRNALGQITKTINSDNSIEEQEFDEYGTLLKKVNRDGSYKIYQYDSLKLLKLIETSDGESIKYEYDALKQVRNVRDKLGLTSFEYDKRGNVTQVKDVNGKVIKYKYGALNELVMHIYPDNSEVNYQYDSALKLTKLESEEHTINYQYQDGLLALKQVGELVSKYEYDGLKRLTRLRHQNNNEILEDYQYQYDNKSNIIGLHKQRVNVKQDSGQFSYEYDKLDRLTKVEQNNELVHTYEYDGLGNRLKMSSKNNEVIYKYNEYSQLISEIYNDVIKEYSYYPSGNLESVSQNNQVINEYQYNIDNRLTKARSNKGEVKFQYDSFNKLISRESNDNHYDYVVDHLKEYDDILQVNSSKQTRHYLYDGFGLATQDSKVAMLDYLGSAISLYDEINNEVQPRVFDEFGNSSNINDGDIGYTGYLFDDVSGLNYAQARFYDSQNARFNGLDNVVNFDETMTGFNRYNYVGNNPLNYIDIDGNTRRRMNKNPRIGKKEKHERSRQNIPKKVFDDMNKYSWQTRLKTGAKVLIIGGGITGGAIGSVFIGAIIGTGFRVLYSEETNIDNITDDMAFGAITGLIGNVMLKSFNVGNWLTKKGGTIWEKFSRAFFKNKMDLISGFAGAGISAILDLIYGNSIDETGKRGVENSLGKFAYFRNFLDLINWLERNASSEKTELNRHIKNENYFNNKLEDYMKQKKYYDGELVFTELALTFKESKIKSKITVFSILLLVICGILFVLLATVYVHIYGTVKNSGTAYIFLFFDYIFISIIYYFVNRAVRRIIYNKYFDDNIRYIAMLGNFYFIVVSVDKDDEFILEYECKHLEDCFLKNVGYGTSFSIIDFEGKDVENLELISNQVSSFSPHGIFRRYKGSGHFYWDTEEQLKYFKKNGSPLEFVSERFIEENTTAI